MNLNLLNKNSLIILIFLKAFSSEEAFSQSYISNPKFESFKDCPNFWSEKSKDFKVNDWYSPTKATPDRFASCSKNSNTGFNWIDEKVNGIRKAYIGIIVQQDGKDYTEYVQTKLLQKLTPNQYYKIKLKIYWPQKSNYAPVPIHLLFSTIKLASRKEGFINAKKALKPLFNFDTLIKQKWTTIEFDYFAEGNEAYLTIGNFYKSKKLTKVGEGQYNFCYYYIDEISIAAQEYKYSGSSDYVHKPNSKSRFEFLDATQNHQPENCNCWNCLIANGKINKEVKTLEQIKDFHLKTGQRINLNKVVFDYESGDMLPESDQELNRLLFMLSEQPKAKLKLIIYTYANNDEAMKIVKSSSMSIYQYLKKKGLKNSFSYIHAVKENLGQGDGTPRDRNIELFIVENE